MHGWRPTTRGPIRQIRMSPDLEVFVLGAKCVDGMGDDREGAQQGASARCEPERGSASHPKGVDRTRHLIKESRPVDP